MNTSKASAGDFDKKLSWQVLRQLEEEYGDSFYILDIRKFERNYHDFLSAFCSIYSNTRIAYSYKTNYTPRLCRHLNALGGYAEVVSKMEYDLAVRIGVPRQRIIFNGPLKYPREMEEAIMAGSIVNVDALYELKMVKELAKRFPSRDIAVGVRCNFDLGAGMVSRFGFDADNGDLDYIFSALERLKNCSISGLHCHFSTPQRSTESYAARTQKMLELCSRYFTKGHPRFVDVGGGFFGTMGPDLKAQFDCAIPCYQEYAEAIATPFLEAFPGPSGPELIVEPGISLVGDVMKFVGKVIGVKTVRSRKLALVTGSVHNVTPTQKEIKMPMHLYHNDRDTSSREIDGDVDVCGYTCMEHDLLYKGYQGDMAEGDYVVFDNVGAYTTVLKPPFINPSPPIIMYDADTDEFSLIKKKESFDEVFASYDM